MENELWLSRDNTPGGYYNIIIGKAKVNNFGLYKNWTACFGASDFHKLFPGQSLRKGCKKRIKRILIELED